MAYTLTFKIIYQYGILYFLKWHSFLSDLEDCVSNSPYEKVKKNSNDNSWYNFYSQLELLTDKEMRTGTQ